MKEVSRTEIERTLHRAMFEKNEERIRNLTNIMNEKHSLDCDCHSCQWAYDRARDNQLQDEIN